ncbi:MAG: hypothetical protein U1F25_10875 [Rubrivivax sp.]
MLISACREITFRGQRALLFVLRNNSECWGRLVVAGKDEFDVVTARDYYERSDDAVLGAFERAAKRGRIEPAVGWLGFGEDDRLRPSAAR